MQAKDSLDAIIAAMGAILMAAPQSERQKLAQAIEQFAIRFPTTFRDLRNGHPARSMRGFFQELIDGVDAQPEVNVQAPARRFQTQNSLLSLFGTATFCSFT